MSIVKVSFGSENIYIDQALLDVIRTAIRTAPKTGRAVGLAGPSGVAKTSLAHALLQEEGYQVFQMDIGGLMDPVAIEGTVILQNGQTILKPSPFLQALLTAKEGERVGLVLDEINRGHPTALNRVFRLLAQRQFHSDWYGLLDLKGKDLVVISTANAGVEYTVSKLDRAMRERHLWVYVPRPDPSVVFTVLQERVPNLTPAQAEAITKLYAASDQLLGVRESLDIAYLLANGVDLKSAVELTVKGAAYVSNTALEVADGLIASAKALT